MTPENLPSSDIPAVRQRWKRQALHRLRFCGLNTHCPPKKHLYLSPRSVLRLKNPWNDTKGKYVNSEERKHLKLILLLPSASEGCGKVMFSVVSAILSKGDLYPIMQREPIPWCKGTGFSMQGTSQEASRSPNLLPRVSSKKKVLTNPIHLCICPILKSRSLIPIEMFSQFCPKTNCTKINLEK